MDTRPTTDRVKEAVFSILQFDLEGRRALDLFAGSARVVGGDAFAFLQSAKETFDIILIDPPFAAGLWENALNSISRFDILSDHGIIVCESPAQQEMPSLPPPYFLHRTYRYGQVKITTYHKEVEG